jgi:hypothetical protein
MKHPNQPTPNHPAPIDPADPLGHAPLDDIEVEEAPEVVGRHRQPKRTFSISLSEAATDRIQRICDVTGASRNSFIQLAVAEKLIRDEKIIQ